MFFSLIYIRIELTFCSKPWLFDIIKYTI